MLYLQVYCWGRNDWGQLGRGGAGGGRHSEPRPVVLPCAARQVSCPGNSTLALTADGRVWAWGLNSGGRLGVGLTVATVTTPKQVTGLER